MKFLLLVLFFQSVNEVKGLDIKAYDCTHSNVTKVGVYNLKATSDCEKFPQWYPTQKDVRVQILTYPTFDHMRKLYNKNEIIPLKLYSKLITCFKSNQQ